VKLRRTILGAGLVALFVAAQAQARPVFNRPAVRQFPSNRMPGWDWWRIYPYSPYNEWRNRPYPYPVPYYVPTGGTTYQSGYDSNPVPPAQPQDASAPTPTGPLKTPPPNSALIVVRVPAEFTPIQFDGVGTTSVGLTRYYSTPELAAGKSHLYTITAVVNRGGRQVTEERQVAVAAGQTVSVDFTRPATK
jgi:uncharacterized protein (TIGR03000 family)